MGEETTEAVGTAPDFGGGRTDSAPAEPLSTRLRPDLFLLDPAVTHLNHGSFGAVPIPVLDAQRRAAEAIERSPERFYRADLAPASDAVRAEVAAFLRTDPDGLALVENATEAAQIALDAVGLETGSEILYTDHTYGWVKAAIARACARSGAVPRCVALPVGGSAALPAVDALTEAPQRPTADVSAEALLAALEPAISKRTKLVVLDQVTSSSALLLPVDEVCEALGEDVPVLIDGAHAPGLIDRPVPPGAAFWLGNLHKWAFAARTAASLVVAPRFRERVQPLVASAGASAGYPRSFSYLGTQDPTAFLALPASLAFPTEHLGMTFSELRRRNAEVLAAGLRLLADRLGLEPATPNGLPLRTLSLDLPGDDKAAAQLTHRLRAAGVEVAITSVAGVLQARVSVQAYVALEDFERLGDALEHVAHTDLQRLAETERNLRSSTEGFLASDRLSRDDAHDRKR